MRPVQNGRTSAVLDTPRFFSRNMSRYGMLECGCNFKGTLKENCDLCDCIDNENHRLNYCPKWKERNLYSNHTKLDFNDIYSNDANVLRDIITVIRKVWNTSNAHGTMLTE